MSKAALAVCASALVILCAGHVAAGAVGGGTAGAGDGSFWGGAKAGGSSGPSTSSGSSQAPVAGTGGSGEASPPGAWVAAPLCAMGGSQTCAEPAYCADGSVEQWVYFQTSDGRQLGGHTSCAGSHVPTASAAAEPQINPVEELRKVSLPESSLLFQPADNQTLVHFESNFFTNASAFATHVPLLGGEISIDFKIRPTEFDWTFGDGTALKTSTPGAPYPQLLVTHEYAKVGTVQAHVDTVWSADYRVNGGSWAPVAGTVIKHGADVTITVRQATPVLTD